ncbi:MAG TPA: 30S ribosomal protein S12 methylthiotransferase RimO [Pirellulales bacterium]|nr:30S ribosomal protein S12 methylthiotransferase RimO [Pirellulales bacterium]
MTSLPIIDSPVLPVAKGAPAAPGQKGTYAFVSLGCPKNLVDSERMLGLLQLDGYRLVHDPVGTDFVVVNTCGFIERARQESYGVIREMLALKRQGQTRGVIVSGCLAEREKEALLDACPGVDRLVGVFGREHVTKMADRLFGNLDEQRTVFQPAPTRPLSDRSRLRITPPHFAYLKISEGCNRLCTFCAIPKMRGKHHTKPMEEVIAEAKELAADGVRELNIVAQDTTYYGIDLYGRPRLAELLSELTQIEGLEWIRLLYLYPEHFTDELMDVLADDNKILPYLDIPLQHINDTMLRRMQRRVNRTQTMQLLDRLQARIDGLVLRTTLITGFPGETDEQFNDLVGLIAERRFQRLGVFTYSFEAGTPSARLDGHLPDDVKEARREAVMAAQQEVAFAWNEEQLGQQREVLLDAPVPNEPNVWVGRTYAEAPDIDGVVYVTGEGLQAGQIVPCEIVATSEYDLIAAPVGEPS